MRRYLYRLGWVVLAVLPVIYGVQIYLAQDLPAVSPWQWLFLFAVVVVLFFARDKDDVLKHHVIGH